MSRERDDPRNPYDNDHRGAETYKHSREFIEFEEWRRERDRRHDGRWDDRSHGGSHHDHGHGCRCRECVEKIVVIIKDERRDCPRDLCSCPECVACRYPGHRCNDRCWDRCWNRGGGCRSEHRDDFHERRECHERRDGCYERVRFDALERPYIERETIETRCTSQFPPLPVPLLTPLPPPPYPLCPAPLYAVPVMPYLPPRETCITKQFIPLPLGGGGCRAEKRW